SSGSPPLRRSAAAGTANAARMSPRTYRRTRSPYLRPLPVSLVPHQGCCATLEADATDLARDADGGVRGVPEPRDASPQLLPVPVERRAYAVAREVEPESGPLVGVVPRVG